VEVLKPRYAVILAAVLVFGAGPAFAGGLTIGQEPYAYPYEPVKTVKQETYLIVRKPYADKIQMAGTGNVASGMKRGEAPGKSGVAHTTGIQFLQATRYQKPSEDVFRVYFDLDSSKLKPAEIKKLNAFSIIYIGRPVKVIGYTCPIGSMEHNKRLAWQRAETVASWLEQHGVKVVEKKGNPKCCYLSLTDLSKNRRVEVLYDSRLVK
jgi:outer membrane protein OmpA-like peptidoglycan-associated protein